MGSAQLNDVVETYDVYLEGEGREGGRDGGREGGGRECVYVRECV